MTPFRVLVLSGGSPLGARICRALAEDARFEVTVTDAREEQARRLLQELPQQQRHRAAALDPAAPALAQRLAGLGLRLLIDPRRTAAPSDYRVAEACLAAGADYLDLAEDRAFVSGIARLDPRARAANRLLVSGAGALPGLSSAVVDAYRDRFARLDGIRIGVYPAPDDPPGNWGRPIQRLENGRWRSTYAWRDLHRFRYPNAPPRWFGGRDAADLELFPERYPGVRTVTCHAGLDLARLLAPLTRVLPPAGRPAPRDGRAPWVGMHVELSGLGHNGERKRLTWYLSADGDAGADIVCAPALIVARKLAAGTLRERGATPCLGLFRLEEFADSARLPQVRLETVAA